MFIWEKPSDVPPGSVPSLTWGFARIHGSASMQGKADVMPPVDPSTLGSCPGLGVGVGFPAPVLARGWGRHLQLLQVHPGGGYGAEFTTVRFASAPAEPGAGPGTRARSIVWRIVGLGLLLLHVVRCCYLCWFFCVGGLGASIVLMPWISHRCSVLCCWTNVQLAQMSPFRT